MNKIKAIQEKIQINKSERLQPRKILVTGGYGYQNTGDEAQLANVLDRLHRCFPDYFVKVLTPDLNYTYSSHHCAVGEASRIAFFNAGESPVYSVIKNRDKRSILHNIINSICKMFFLVKSEWIYFNGILTKVGLPSFLLSPRAVALLYDLQSSSMLYFEGGGYLTGATLSRLWDGILMCRLASLYHVPIVMSGQTIGVWNTNFNKWYAKKGFSKVRLISLRDALFSPVALSEIGLNGSNIYPVCDDALFCQCQKDHTIINMYLELSGINEDFLENGYFAVNIHDWGINSTEEENKLFGKLAPVIQKILEDTNKNIIFIPMIPSDVDAMEKYLISHNDKRIKIFHYDYDFRNIRAVIRDSFACITMKHHPIIFSAGECVPVISVNRSAYYEHKNKGALDILGIIEFSINLDDIDYFEKYKNLFETLVKNRESISRRMEKKLSEIRINIEKFENELTNILQER